MVHTIFLDDMINIKNLDPNKIKINEQSYKRIFIYYVGYMTRNSVKLLYIMINEINGYIEECNGNRYLSHLFLLMKANAS